MQVQLIKINESLFSGDAKSVIAPGITGELQILSGHEPLVTVLKAGTVTVMTEEGKNESFDIEHGYLEVTPEQVTIML